MRRARAIALGTLGLGCAWLAVSAMSGLPTLADRTGSSRMTDTSDTRLGRVIGPHAAAHAGQSGVLDLPDGRDAFATRVLMARAAERTIDAQYYIWHDDLTGSLLFDELRAAADRGVRVRLLLDDHSTRGLDATLAGLDSHPKIEVRLFNPFAIRGPRFLNYLTDFARLNRRMHNKSLTVDNQATIVGGRNVGDEYFGAGEGALFADLDVLAVGSVVDDVSHQFDRYWSSASAYPVSRLVPTASPGAIDGVKQRATDAALDSRARRYLDAVRSLAIIDRLNDGDARFEWTDARMVTDDPAKGLGRAQPGELMITRLEDLLEAPQRTLGLVSAYFVPTRAGEAAFAKLAKEGVRVNVLTNSLQATDVPLVHAGYAPYRKALLSAGVKLWELKAGQDGAGSQREASGAAGSGSSGSSSGTALHAKTFTVDGDRVFVGSFNFDPRSARLNTELGFVIRSSELARRMDRTFARAIPQRAYEVRLTDEGELVWIERIGTRELLHRQEPGTIWWQRTQVDLLSRLPIEWLL